MKPINIGIIGCGNISGIYLKNLPTLRNINVLAVADLDLERAKAKAQEFKVPHALTPDELLKRDDIDAVLNITIPVAHADVAMQVLNAGKHVYNEKPLAVELKDAKAMLELAKSKNVRVGCAPDTFFGAAPQTIRVLLDRGRIGQPIYISGFMAYTGPDKWHPDPAFFFKPGAGPLFDMAPYYLTAFIHYLGSIKRVVAMAKTTFAEREVGTGPKQGQKIKVETPTHISTLLEFENGVLGNLVTSFDMVPGSAPSIEICGTQGAITVPDPNWFGGSGGKMTIDWRDNTNMWTKESWREEAIARPHTENMRGLGLADMLYAHQENRPHRASGDMAYHVLEVMHSVLESVRENRPVTLESRVPRPDLLDEVYAKAMLK
ncbi:MAG: Gfo/Idh/MocA family protein [Trueperaceae bacterium]